MSQESRETFSKAVEDKIDYYRSEFELSYSDVVSALEFIKFKMLQEAFEDEPQELNKV